MARRKMRVGECRKTKNGQPYCMTKNGVRFKKRAGRSRRVSGSRSSRGKTCVRFKRVRVKGTTGTQRRCAKYK